MSILHNNDTIWDTYFQCISPNNLQQTHKLRKKSKKMLVYYYFDFLATLPFGTVKLSTPSGTPHNTLNCPPAPPQTILTPFVAVLTIFVGVSISPEGFSEV